MTIFKPVAVYPNKSAFNMVKVYQIVSKFCIDLSNFYAGVPNFLDQDYQYSGENYLGITFQDPDRRWQTD